MDDKDEVRELVNSARESPEGFAELYKYYFPKIYGYIAVRLMNASDAEDVTALTFEKALRSLKRFDETKASFTTWIYTIAHNNVIDHVRGSAKGPLPASEQEQLEMAGAPDNGIANVDWLQSVMKCIRQLPERHQQLLVLKFMIGLSNKDIREILGCSQGAYDMRLSRALRSLKKVAVREHLLEGILEGGANE